MITIPDYWYNCHIWQYRRNGMCQDIIGDVFIMFGEKIFLHRN